MLTTGALLITGAGFLAVASVFGTAGATLVAAGFAISTDFAVAAVFAAGDLVFLSATSAGLADFTDAFLASFFETSGLAPLEAGLVAVVFGATDLPGAGLLDAVATAFAEVFAATTAGLGFADFKAVALRQPVWCHRSWLRSSWLKWLWS